MTARGPIRFATEANWQALLETLARDYELLGPTGDGEVHLDVLQPGEVALPRARMVDPVLKVALFPVREDLGGYFEGEGGTKARDVPPRAVVGVAACDISSLRVLDYIFLQGEIIDPQYRCRRERTFIVSQDCTAPREVCFCAGVGGRPYPTEGFDINVSPLGEEMESGVLLEAGSERGEAVLASLGLPEANAEQITRRDSRRAEVSERVALQARNFGLPVEPQAIQRRLRQAVEAPLWKREAEKCVECGACNFICPTCHCFLLSDLLSGDLCRRFKNWDACQYEGFARVAGGANPRPHRWERLRNRFDKKFDFFVTHLKEVACTGCGRCVEACPGRIDLREILKELVHG